MKQNGVCYLKREERIKAKKEKNAVVKLAI